MNFLKETKKAIEDSGHKIEDVMFIGSNDGKYRMNWDKFVKKSDFSYDNGYGASIIATNLIIYFKDHTYIRRGEYDGSEWWEYDVARIFDENDYYQELNTLKD